MATPPASATLVETIILGGIKAAHWRKAFKIDFFQDFVAESRWPLGVRSDHPGVV